jgi:hypothetical protein
MANVGNTFGRIALTVAVVVSALAGAVPARAATVAATVAGTGDNIVVRWNTAVLDAVRNSTLGPPMVSRALAIIHTCVFDAWAAYDARAIGTQFGGALRRPRDERTPANKTEAISFAAHRAAVDLFPGRRAQLDAFMVSLGYDPASLPTDPATPSGIGVTACAAVLEERHQDGSNQLNGYADTSGYVPVNAPMVVAGPIDPATVRDASRWQPLTFVNRAGVTVTPGFLAPHWLGVKPFGLTSGSQFRSTRPPARFGSGTYREQAADLLALSANLTDRHKAVSEYWSDGPASETPPGHWCLLATQVSRRDHHSLDQDAKLFFALTNALMDAGIASWDDKRAFDSQRPITALRTLYQGRTVRAWGGPGQGTRDIDGGAWLAYQPSFFPTPPFAEYVSGHSTFSAAAAQILKSFKGNDIFGYAVTIRAGSSVIEPGLTPAADVTLSWPTFTSAAAEAGMSRRYGGIHFEPGDLDGRQLGRQVGAQVWLTAKRYLG